MKSLQKMAVVPVDARYLKCAEELREEASRIAMLIARSSHGNPAVPAALDAHVSIMLQAIAAEHMAYGRETLAKHYLASALRVEVEI